MASLKDLRNRIASVKSTQKITKAMQMVAAAKLRRAEDAAAAARPYADRMASVLANIAGAVEGDGPPLMVGTGKDDVHLLVVFTAERGLCGGFNASIIKHARQHQRRLEAEGKTVKFFAVGKKAWDMMRRDLSGKIVERIDFREVKQIGFDQADTLGDKIMELFAKGEFDVCTIFYSAFQNVITQVPTGQQVIPADLSGAGHDNGSASVAAVYEYEPEPAAILDALIPRNIKVQILHAMLENAASEQGARMSAMDNATRNAGEMIDKLSVSYNRQRQAQITTELVEIISGAEAL
ncbi:F0F1 ATP synthase subunit gamma [Aurantimonas sp. 22II-16-19i]|uniref:F0F1 ATP synthase subunit gamma n=1 Tax=Aurantimonas sp. 22II-16-19i TaxID=1317114 RepID=UPI0009F7F776|nr:F0F1 ATP synthase subunit gamma [Aurantimonas sp. 22II-16-19i]ORE97646.1 F0F1 ATP synthase subunit gamma [Aurantimonas sp. 22II-16-19i]